MRCHATTCRSHWTALPSRWSWDARPRRGCARHSGPDMASHPPAARDQGRLLTWALRALVVGAAAGLIGALFRLVLVRADDLRDRVIGWAHGEALLGFGLIVVAGAAAALVATWLV